MNEHYCKREPEVAAAIGDGSCDAAILAHARSCPVCAEILLVGTFLREGSRLSAREVAGVPDVNAVWRKAQALARERALLRATLPIRAARIAAYSVGALVAAPLLVRSRWLWAHMPELWPTHAAAQNQPWFSGSSMGLMLAITAATVLIGLSCWYMLREE